ncbi:MAG: hypothetical protein V4641_31260 [Pseudomonadota bacterium]
MAGKFPESFNDPLYASLDASHEQKLDLPVGLLSSIRTAGERSNASATNKFGTSSPYQFTPPTRKAILEKYGIDVLLSPENASEGAGLLLQESLKRNNNDVERAVREYHGGVKPENWGPVNNAYAKRVMKAQGAAKEQTLDSGFAKFMAANPAVPADHAQQQPVDAAQAPAQGADAPAEKQPAKDDLSAGFGSWLAANPGAGKYKPPPEDPGIIANIKESITGAKRRTAETEAAPDWAGMPELNSASMAGFKTGLGTMVSNPEESVQIIKNNFPGVQARQDDHGNYFLKSSIDGKEYAIKPGFRPSDIPRAGAGLLAFTPAGRATTITGSMLAGGATQAAIEASQAATGGNFDSDQVAMATVASGTVPAVVRTVQAAKNPLMAALGREPVVPPVPPGAPPVPPTPAAPAVMSAEELANTARTAANGGLGSKGATRDLAAQIFPNEKTIEAAKRLGIEEHLQPDHVTTNQAYRELAQAIKSVPGSETRAAEVAGLEQVAKRADDLVDELGGAKDLSTLDATLKARMQATQTELSKKAGELYDQVLTAIPKRTVVNADETLGFLKAHAADLGGAKRLLPTERNLLASLEGGDGPLTYAFLDQTRKQIGQAMRKASGPFADSESGTLKKLYSTLSKDQEDVAAAAGYGDLYKAAKSVVGVRKGLEDDIVSLFGKELNKSMVSDLTQSMAALPKGDVSKLAKLLKAIPEDMRQQTVASGLSTAFNVSAKNQQLSFKNFANWYEGLLKNKQAHAMLMSNLPPEARKRFSDLYRVSKGIDSATRERITTGRIMAVSEQLRGADNLMANVFDLAKRSSGGLAAEAVTSSMGMHGAGLASGIASALTKGKTNALKAADALISSPEYLAAVKAAGTPGAGPATRRLAMSRVFKDFAREVKQPRELSDPEKWIQRSLLTTNAEYKENKTKEGK